jgi:hypothetical protein
LSRRQEAREEQDENPPIAHGAKNMASWLPVNSLTRKVPLILPKNGLPNVASRAPIPRRGRLRLQRSLG